MSVPVAYLGIILIWATTPLAIQWSSQGAGYAFAVLARMLIGVLIAALVIAFWRIPFPLHARARRAYLVGGLGLFGGMALTYWGARYIHSGLVSVIFGLSPLLAGVFSAIFLGEHSLTRLRVLGLTLAIAGLSVIFLEGGSFGGEHALLGLAALLLAVCIYSGCLVWLKQIGDDSPPTGNHVGNTDSFLAIIWFALAWQRWPVASRRTGTRARSDCLPWRLWLGHRLCALLLCDPSSGYCAGCLDYADHPSAGLAAGPFPEWRNGCTALVARYPDDSCRAGAASE